MRPTTSAAASKPLPNFADNYVTEELPYERLMQIANLVDALTEITRALKEASKRRYKPRDNYISQRIALAKDSLFHAGISVKTHET